MKTLPPPFFAIGLGLSLGGIAPLCTILENLPKRINASFFIIQNNSVNYQGYLPEILAGSSKLKVSIASNGQSFQSNNIYLLSALNCNSFQREKIVIEAETDSELIKTPINCLFNSMAADFGIRALTVALSHSRDGSEGLININRQGGISFAADSEYQEFLPATETFDYAGMVNFHRSPETIASLIREIVKD